MAEEIGECRDGVTGEARHDSPVTAAYLVRTTTAMAEHMWCRACLSEALRQPDGDQVASAELIRPATDPFTQSQDGRMRARLEQVVSERT